MERGKSLGVNGVHSVSSEPLPDLLMPCGLIEGLFFFFSIDGELQLRNLMWTLFANLISNDQTG